MILARPQEPRAETPAATPARFSSPAVTAEKETDLRGLIAAFPAPVMSFMSGSGMVFVSATSADAAVSDGFGRVASLYWQTPEGEPVLLRSIWPADALSLLEEGYHFSAAPAPSLFGLPSVRMENGSTLRFHVATDQALYELLVPRSPRIDPGTLCRSLQLFTVSPQE